MSDIQSLNFDDDESLHIESPIASPISKINNHNRGASKQKLTHQLYAKYINVLTSQKLSGKISINPQFEQFINEDLPENIKNVSFMGTKRVGKSFLLDCLLSSQNGQVHRLMSKNQQQLINASPLPSKGAKGERIIYFDCNGQPTPQLFLLMYCVSSTIVYSLNQNNPNEQSVLMQCSAYVHESMQNDLPNMFCPQLIIVRRDCQKQTLEVDLVRKIAQFGLFQAQIPVFNMPYPGGRDIMVKQLLDIPTNQLNGVFVAEVERLHEEISNAKILKCNGFPLNSKTQTLLMGSILKSVSHQHMEWKAIWNDVDEALAVQYYNCYLQTYSEELERQLQNEKPYDKYSMYKKLGSIKKKVNKKMSHQQKPFDSSVFDRYKDKLEETIKNKQALVKNVNQAKSRQTHQTNYSNLANDLNAIGYNELIQNYCKSALDDQKTDVLLQQFQKIVSSNPPTPLNPPQNNPPKLTKNIVKKVSPQLVSIDKQIQQLNRLILEKSKFRTENQKNEKLFKSSLEQKKNKLKELQMEYENLANQPRSVVKQQNKNNEELAQLQKQKLKLTQIIQNCEREVQNLKKQKQNNLKQTTAKLEKELQMQQETYRRLKNEKKVVQAYEPKASMAGNKSKKTCCLLI